MPTLKAVKPGKWGGVAEDKRVAWLEPFKVVIAWVAGTRGRKREARDDPMVVQPMRDELTQIAFKRNR